MWYPAATYHTHPLIVRELPEIRSLDKVMGVEEKTTTRRIVWHRYQ